MSEKLLIEELKNARDLWKARALALLNQKEEEEMGRSQKQKGNRRELEWAKLVQGERIPGSGAYKRELRSLEADVAGGGPFDGLTYEVKARKDGFKTLYKWLYQDQVDALALKADRKEWLVVLPASTYLELVENLHSCLETFLGNKINNPSGVLREIHGGIGPVLDPDLDLLLED